MYVVSMKERKQDARGQVLAHLSPVSESTVFGGPLMAGPCFVVGIPRAGDHVAALTSPLERCSVDGPAKDVELPAHRDRESVLHHCPPSRNLRSVGRSDGC